MLSVGYETILLIDDNIHVRESLAEILECYGYNVIAAVDGEDGINKFIEHKDEVSLLLTDLMMPKKNGNEVYQEIIKINPDIKVIFMSGYSASLFIGLKDEALHFMPKPLSPMKLI